MINSNITDVDYEYCLPYKKTLKLIAGTNMVHFVFDGKGCFNGHEITAGQGFICQNGKECEYMADPSDPWQYGWINIKNSTQMDTLRLNLAPNSDNIFDFDKSLPYQRVFMEAVYINDKRLSVHRGISSETKKQIHLGAYYRLLSVLSYEKRPETEKSLYPKTDYYIQSALMTIESEYHKHSFNVESLAKSINISTGYLRNLFAKQFNISPKEYLQNFRMDKAKEYITTTHYPISLIATSVGYSDLYLFSKMFKKRFGCSPSAYRQYNSTIK